jgi:hypothetical protein
MSFVFNPTSLAGTVVGNSIQVSLTFNTAGDLPLTFAQLAVNVVNYGAANSTQSYSILYQDVSTYVAAKSLENNGTPPNQYFFSINDIIKPAVYNIQVVENSTAGTEQQVFIGANSAQLNVVASAVPAAPTLAMVSAPTFSQNATAGGGVDVSSYTLKNTFGLTGGLPLKNAKAWAVWKKADGSGSVTTLAQVAVPSSAPPAVTMTGSGFTGVLPDSYIYFYGTVDNVLGESVASPSLALYVSQRVPAPVIAKATGINAGVSVNGTINMSVATSANSTPKLSIVAIKCSAYNAASPYAGWKSTNVFNYVLSEANISTGTSSNGVTSTGQFKFTVSQVDGAAILPFIAYYFLAIQSIADVSAAVIGGDQLPSNQSISPIASLVLFPGMANWAVLIAPLPKIVTTGQTYTAADKELKFNGLALTNSVSTAYIKWTASNGSTAFPAVEMVSPGYAAAPSSINTFTNIEENDASTFTFTATTQALVSTAELAFFGIELPSFVFQDSIDFMYYSLLTTSPATATRKKTQDSTTLPKPTNATMNVARVGSKILLKVNWVSPSYSVLNAKKLKLFGANVKLALGAYPGTTPSDPATWTALPIGPSDATVMQVTANTPSTSSSTSDVAESAIVSLYAGDVAGGFPANNTYSAGVQLIYIDQNDDTQVISGWLVASGVSSFTVPAAVLSSAAAVEISKNSPGTIVTSVKVKVTAPVKSVFLTDSADYITNAQVNNPECSFQPASAVVTLIDSSGMQLGISTVSFAGQIFGTVAISSSATFSGLGLTREIVYAHAVLKWQMYDKYNVASGPLISGAVSETAILTVTIPPSFVPNSTELVQISPVKTGTARLDSDVKKFKVTTKVQINDNVNMEIFAIVPHATASGGAAVSSGKLVLTQLGATVNDIATYESAEVFAFAGASYDDPATLPIHLLALSTAGAAFIII